jgi:hypothetical protein
VIQPEETSKASSKPKDHDIVNPYASEAAVAGEEDDHYESLADTVADNIMDTVGVQPDDKVNEDLSAVTKDHDVNMVEEEK